jgi:serine protease AprX
MGHYNLGLTHWRQQAWSMILPTVEPLICSFCGCSLDHTIAHMNRALEAHIARAMQALHPGWVPDATACPQCIQVAVRAIARPGQASPNGQPGCSFPAYSGAEPRLLATPQRVRASPRYAGRGVTIAFLDSGFYPHADLTVPRNRIRAHIDATVSHPVERPNFRRAEATSWHGLMVSCIGAGNGHQSAGLYRGIASEADLVLVKTGNRRSRRIPDRDIVRALQWVVDNHEAYGIQIVNISLGGDVPSTGDPTPLDVLVEEAVAHGLIVVAAAGNGGVNQIIPPASARSAITVGGLDDQNVLDERYWRMWRSSYGRGVGDVGKPDLIAPSIWLAAPILPRTWVHNEAQLLWHLEQLPDGELSRFLISSTARARFEKDTLRQPPGQVRALIRRRIVEQKYIHSHYQHVDGTSMAAPIVSAVAAQMLEANPALSAAQVKDLLVSTARPLPYVPRAEQGAGALDGARAVAGALRAPGGRLAGMPMSPHVTPLGVTFVCHAPEAREVTLVASFNGWQPQLGEMCQTWPGVWQCVVPSLPAGTHAYKFLIDRTYWIHDVESSAQIEDGSGGVHSLLTVV